MLSFSFEVLRYEMSSSDRFCLKNGSLSCCEIMARSWYFVMLAGVGGGRFGFSSGSVGFVSSGLSVSSSPFCVESF